MNDITIQPYVPKRKISLMVSFLIISTFIAFIPFSNASNVLPNESTNGWEIQNCGTTDNVYGVSFVDSNNGWVVGGSWDTFYGFLRHTTDGGETWNPSGRNAIPDYQSEPIPILFDVSFYNVDTGMAVGWNGKIHYTSDGGINWNFHQPFWLSTYYGAHMIDENWGYAVGVYPMFYQCLATRTWDSWESYYSFYFPLYVPGEGFYDISKVSDVYFMDHHHGFATVDAGYPGAIIYTFNGGYDWKTVYWNPTASLNAIDFPSSDIGYAVGNFGLILKTNDGGSTWRELDSEINSNLLDVSFPTEKIGTAVGEDGLIIRTVDGGRTWHMQESGTTVNLNAVEFINQYNGFAVGDDGIILHTTTGGDHIFLSITAR